MLPYNPVRIGIFGSAARGEDLPGSDRNICAIASIRLNICRENCTTMTVLNSNGANRMLSSAILKLWEASANVSEDLKAQYPDVAWKEMRGMKNYVTHPYFGVELGDIWSTVVNDIPVLKKQIGDIIDDLEGN
jgi:uncharacterized protein with HEPN domain